jgi:CxxC motif-containing protein
MKHCLVKCIVCPTGCDIQVTVDQEKAADIQGYQCKRGRKYAVSECLHPERLLTTTVKVSNGKIPVAAVRTQKPVPKDKIFECMEEIRQVCIEAPVSVGDIVLRNVAETGINVIVTRPDEGR